MAVSVRIAERSDAVTLLSLIDALANFEELAGPDKAARDRFIRDGWPQDGRPARFDAWIAEVSEPPGAPEAAGYAITFETYSSFLARPTLYLEDLFVLPNYRRQAVGAALFERLLNEAKARGCGRMEWVVLDWNTGAQEFYHRFGGAHINEWHHYRRLIDPD